MWKVRLGNAILVWVFLFFSLGGGTVRGVVCVREVLEILQCLCILFCLLSIPFVHFSLIFFYSSMSPLFFLMFKLSGFPNKFFSSVLSSFDYESYSSFLYVMFPLSKFIYVPHPSLYLCLPFFSVVKPHMVFMILLFFFIYLFSLSLQTRLRPCMFPIISLDPKIFLLQKRITN